MNSWGIKFPEDDFTLSWSKFLGIDVLIPATVVQVADPEHGQRLSARSKIIELFGSTWNQSMPYKSYWKPPPLVGLSEHLANISNPLRDANERSRHAALYGVQTTPVRMHETTSGAVPALCKTMALCDPKLRFDPVPVEKKPIMDGLSPRDRAKRVMQNRRMLYGKNGAYFWWAFLMGSMIIAIGALIAALSPNFCEW
jgi:hypothetical protein